MAVPGCPRPGHEGSKVVRDGKYGKVGHRRQLYRCYPSNGNRWHRFAPTLPRQMTVSGSCDECERYYGADEGPSACRHYDFAVRHAAWALVQVGNGRSYRRVGAEIRRRAGREWTRDGASVWSPHSRLLEDWIEVFAPVLWEEFAPRAWPDVLVLDRVPFRLRNRKTTGKGGPSGVAFNVFAGLGYTPDGQGQIWRYQAFPRARKATWMAFLRSLPGRPGHIVCDGEQAITEAIAAVWPPTSTDPAPVIHLCQWHLKKPALAILKGYGCDHPSHPLRRQLEGSMRSVKAWAGFGRFQSYYAYPELDALWKEATPRVLHEIAKNAPGVPHTGGLLELHLQTLRGAIEPRRQFFHNRERMNRLLMLLVLAANRHNDETLYARIIRSHLETTGGRHVKQRHIDDRKKAGRRVSSLRY
jgi:hypothetical protein